MSAPAAPVKTLTAEDVRARLAHLETHVDVLVDELDSSHNAYLVAVALSRLAAMTAKVRAHLPH